MRLQSWPAILFLMFLLLKLTHNITWSWWWVASPLWIAYAALFFIFMIEISAAARKDRR